MAGLLVFAVKDRADLASDLEIVSILGEESARMPYVKWRRNRLEREAPGGAMTNLLPI